MNKVLVGQITSAHGIKGMVKVFPYTDEPERFLELKYVYLGDSDSKSEIESVSFQKNLVLLKLFEIEDRNQAERLKGTNIYIGIEDRKDLSQDEYFIDDLIGLSVYDSKDSKYLGEVVDFIGQIGNDILLIKTDGGEFMLPFVEAFVETVNIDEKYIKVNLIEGML